MKTLTTPEATLHVTERDDYTYALTREGREMHLWRVTLRYEGVKSRVFVLAADHNEAIAQAKCGIDNSRHSHIKATAKRIPFRLRSWGTTAF